MAVDVMSRKTVSHMLAGFSMLAAVSMLAGVSMLSQRTLTPTGVHPSSVAHSGDEARSRITLTPLLRLRLRWAVSPQIGSK